MTLLKQQAKAEWLSLLIWAALLSIMNAYTVVLWDNLRASGSLAILEDVIRSILPPAMQAMFSTSLTSLAGWLQANTFGGWMPLPMIIYTALFVTGIVAREMDRRTMEFLLSLPLARWRVLTWRMGGLLGALAVIHLVNITAITTAVIAIGQEPDIGAYLLVSLNSLLLYMALGSLMLLASLFLDDYGRAVSATVGVGFILWFTHTGSKEATGFLGALREALPFAHYDPAAILIRGEVPWGSMAYLAAIGGVSVGLSILLFQRKQIAV